MRRILALPAVLVVFAVLLTACSSSGARAKGSSDVLRLGVFPTLTQSPGLVGIAGGILQKDLGSTNVKVFPFNSGSEASNALVSGSIDATYIGPGPTVSLYEKTHDVSVVSGATENGAFLVVRNGSGIAKASDFAGKKVADPGTGNTQDVALRTWLADNGLKPTDSGGNVTIVPMTSNSQVVQLFQAGQVDAAWVPEPYASLLVSQNLGKVFVDESTLWPGGKFLTANLLVSNTYMSAHPTIVQKLVQGNVDSILYIQKNSTQAEQLANKELAKLGGTSLPSDVLASAWGHMNFTWDPLASSLVTNAQRAYKLGFITTNPTDIMNVYNLTDLNTYLTQIGQPTIKASS